MGKHKSHKRHRTSSATPQKVNTRADNADLTMSDPWAHQAEMVKRAQPIEPIAIQKPTPLSPSFSAPMSTISVPRDPNVLPSLVYQRMAAIRSDAKQRPTFFGAVRLDDKDAAKNSGEPLRDNAPIPGQHEVKERKEKKAKEGKFTEKSTKPIDEAAEAMRRETKKKIKAELEQQTARAIEGMHAAAGVGVNESRKRKREDDNGEEFKRRVEVEASAVKRLRETLPTFILDRVSRTLERADGNKPTEMAVLLTAARDTVLDLARGQLLHTQQFSNVVQTEMSRIIDAQGRRIKELEEEGRDKESASASKPIRTVAETLDDSSSEGSDHDTEENEVAKMVGIPESVKPKLAQLAQGPRPLDSLCPPQ